MKRFLAMYFLFLILLFIFFYAPTWNVSIYLNSLQTETTLYFLAMFLAPNQLEGTEILINPNYRIIITQACNGMIPTLFLFASILAYPSSYLQKIFWMFLGYGLFIIVNVLRILVVVNITQNGSGHEDFYWSHDLLGNTMLMITGLGLFIGFIKSSSKI